MTECVQEAEKSISDLNFQPSSLTSSLLRKILGAVLQPSPPLEWGRDTSYLKDLIWLFLCSISESSKLLNSKHGTRQS